MGKIWTKLGMFILILACLFNIVYKLTTRISLSNEISASAEYVKQLVETKDNLEKK